MTTGVSSSTSEQAEQVTVNAPVDGYADPVSAAATGAEQSDKVGLPDGYSAIRDNSDIQFAPLAPKDVEPREPSWIERALTDFFEWLSDLLAPVGNALGMNWSVLRWVLLAIVVVIVVYAIVRLVGPLAMRGRNVAADTDDAEPQWQPDRRESLALLKDADLLAADGRFDEAARLLLRRSVGQIAAARPDWVDPSSTARELAALPALSDAARGAFAVISEAVERSLFALRQLSQEDWESARAAYADFALARIDARTDAISADAGRSAGPS